MIFFFKKCSVTCGSGWRLRRIECRSSSRNESVDASKCKSDSQPAYYEQCNAIECPRWQFGSWSSCSNECGEGMRRRMVLCMAADGLVTIETACPLAQRPDDYQKCTGHAACTRWTTSHWSECDFKTCTKVRSVYCAHENGTRLVVESECTRSEKPNYIAECDSRASCAQYQNVVGGGGGNNQETKPLAAKNMTSALSLGYKNNLSVYFLFTFLIKKKSQ